MLILACVLGIGILPAYSEEVPPVEVGSPSQKHTTTENAPSMWELTTVPDVWKKLGGGRQESYHWFRCLVDVPAAWEGQKLFLFVEAVDDAREVYLNGQRVGMVGTFPPEYRSGLGAALRFPVNPNKVFFGDTNVVSIRVYHNSNRIGFNAAAPVLFAESEAIRMKGTWEHQQGDNLAWGKLAERPRIQQQAVFGDVEAADTVEEILKQLDNDPGPQSVVDSMRKIRVPNDLVLECVVAEPHVRQPLSFKWDERGRLWVVQYLQYPNPAGLTMVSRDIYLRAVYDKTPAPPPNHFPGKDKITIHEDTDGDGTYDLHKTFIEGLSLVTSFARGRGGVWVLNPPYLLFYPDRDQDDVPDSDPEVHLEGFGLEDSHALANNLRWGPDGWLYGAQGSTVSGNIRRFGTDDPTVHSEGQLIWRYHPESQQYEVFAEGGGNSFGVEFDARGNVFSGHNGGNTRGFHYVQGGFYQKGFGKHGALSNPFAFGYFSAMAHHDVPRFTHTFVIYEANSLPETYRGKLFGVAPLQSHIVQSAVATDGLTFRTQDEGFLLESDDHWFRPVDIQTGPDGCIYVADMYEQRIDHASHYQGRIHRESGRIYRLRPKAKPPEQPQDLSLFSTDEIVDLLKHKNKWYRQTALRLLADRRDASIYPKLRQHLGTEEGQLALELLWAMHVSGGWTDQEACKDLCHIDPHVRLWAARLLCDRGSVSKSLAARLAKIAGSEPDLLARCQWACSAKRLSAHQALPIVANLLDHDEDVDDPWIPLLLWWAIEAQMDSDPESVLRLFAEESFWNEPLVDKHILERVMRRFAQSGHRRDLFYCARLLELAPDKKHTTKLLAGFEEAYRGRSLAELPDELVDALAATGGGSLALRLRQKDPESVRQALATILDPEGDMEQRRQLVRILGDLQLAESVPVLLELVEKAEQPDIRRNSLTALQAFDDPQLGQRVAELFPQLPQDTHESALMLLASRPAWTFALLEAVDRGDVASESLQPSVVRRMLLHRDKSIETSVRQRWGHLEAPQTEEMFAEIDRVKGILESGSGIPHHGKKIFMQSCGKCHVLFGQGGHIGPDLTVYHRNDLRRMLVNVINPSWEIREGFENTVIYTEDGLTVNGFVTDEDNQMVVLKTADGQNVMIRKDQIEGQLASKHSLMPEGILRNFTDQQLRNLFAYLRASQPLP